MGEFADMAIDEAMDMEDLRFSYRAGSMTDQVAYDLGIIDEKGFYRRVPSFGPQKIQRCKYCKAPASWKLLDTKKWRLYSDNAPHTCDEYMAAMKEREKC